MPENNRIKKIVRVTRPQMQELQRSGSLYGHDYDPAHCLYIVDDGLELPNENGNYVITTDNNGRSFDYAVLSTPVENYYHWEGQWEVDPEDPNIRTKIEIDINDVNVDLASPAGTYTLKGTKVTTTITENISTGDETSTTTTEPYEVTYNVPFIENSSVGTLALAEDLPEISLVTTTGSESITVDSDTLSLVTRDTAQTIPGQKTFENKIKINDETSTAILDNDWFIEAAANYNLYVGRGTDRRFVFQSNLFAPNTYDVVSSNLGDEHYKWNNLYIGGTINAGQVIKSTYSGATYALMKRGDDAYVICNQATNKGIRIDGGNNALLPNISSNSSLGSTTDIWTNLYLSGNLSDGTNSITVANIQEKVQVKRYI